MISPRAIVASVLRPLLRAVEGQPRPGPWRLPISGGWLPADVGNTWNWWQLGHSLAAGPHRSAIVEAVRSLLFGNTYAVALRSHRFEIDELHLMDPSMSAPAVAETGEIFYKLAGKDVIQRQLGEQQLIGPARDVLHIRLHSSGHYPNPLIGETPLIAAYGDPAMFESMKYQQEQYLQNRAAPSAVLTTDLHLDANQVQNLRDRWNEQAKGLHSGGVPILTHGLKVHPWTQPAAARDLQLAELRKLTDQHVALVFRIPLQILGLGSAPAGRDRAALCVLARLRFRILPKPSRGKFRQVLQSRGPARRVHRVQHRRSAALGAEGSN